MKPNTVNNDNGKRVAATILSLVTLALVAGGVIAAYGYLRGLWIEQCVIHDVSGQVTVEVNSGKMVKAETIREAFGLKKGANLAEIDFRGRRKEVLERYPMIRDLTIERHLPDRISIAVGEREPVARMNVRGGKSETGRVSDAEGVVFPCRRGTVMLPVIRESPSAPFTPNGARLTGRKLSALRLLEVSKDPAYSVLGILEVDVSKPDFLVLTLGNSSTAVITWDGMEGGERSSAKALEERLADLAAAVRNNPRTDTVTWNATLPGQVSAISQGTAP